MEKSLKGYEFLNLEKERLLNHPLFDDVLMKTISSLEVFELNKAKKFALLYYPHILRTRLYQANTLGITPDENIQFVLSEILHDEYGSGNIENSHMQLYRKFMHAMRLQQEDYQQQNIIPELQEYISSMMQLTQGDDWLAAVAAVGIASEHPIPKHYSLLLKGLRKISGVSEEDLELFIGHIDLDIEHSEQIEEAILPYLDNPKNQIRFSRGIDISMNARRKFHHGLYREVFG